MSSSFNNLMNMVSEAAVSIGLKVTPLCDGFILEIANSKIHKYIYNDHFGINTDTALEIATDKYATSEILKLHNIPHVEHFLVVNPKLKYYSVLQNQKIINDVYNDFGRNPIVVKPNTGSCGRGVTYCKNIPKILHEIDKLFMTDSMVSISPFYEAESEYRCFFLNGKILYIYQKIRTSDWRFNLHNGADSKVLKRTNNNAYFYDSLVNLAEAAGNAIDINFATIDIFNIGSKEKPHFLVLEINAGVTCSKYIAKHPDEKEDIEKIYREVLKQIFLE